MSSLHNVFRGTAENPYHLSVGAVVLDEQGRVCCQSIAEFDACRDLHLLMRETLEPGESVEAAVHRGLMEEMGIEADIVAFLGALVSTFPRGASSIEKTTLYFLCRMRMFDPTRRDHTDPDFANDVEWLDLEELSVRSRDQAARCGRSDFDESTILDRVRRRA